MYKKIKIVSITGFVILVLLLVKMLFQQQFQSVEDLQIYMQRFGVFAPVFLTLFQAFQVVVPVLPGYLGCAVGSIAFGPTVGFICNYVGICIGSIIAYFLAKKYGINLVMELFSEKMYNKWSERIERSKSYNWFLFIATLLPLFPDDFLCYFSGLVKMDRRKFIWIILLGKPWCILAYSIAFGMIK